MQQQKGHLRQRHGSGALQLEQFDRDSREQSPYNNVEDDDQTYLHDPAMNTKNQYSPSTLEAGPQHPSSSSSSSNTNSNNAYLTPTSPQKELPEGATTPLNEDQTADGFPIQQYPPPSPTWGNMPAKPQLAILALSRFVDFFQMAALQTIMVHQLKSFDEGLPDSVISHQAGVLQGSFTAAQIITSVLWGRAADQPEVGRKLVLNIGLVGTGVTCIGLAFSKSYAQAVAWRVLGGAVNGTVGSARTMVAECVPKRYHPRAFLLLPAAFNFANMLGPILSGMLVDPVDGFPKLFGPGSAFGGADGVVWMREYPYALANLLSTVLLFLEAILVGIGCKETLKGHRQMQISELDPVRLVRSAVAKVRGIKEQGYRLVDARKGLLSGREEGSIELDRLEEDEGVPNEKGADRPPQRLAFHRLWTTNVLWTLLSIAIFDFHMGYVFAPSPCHPSPTIPIPDTNTQQRLREPLDSLPLHLPRVRPRLQSFQPTPPTPARAPLRLQIQRRPRLPTPHHRLRNGHHRLHRHRPPIHPLPVRQRQIRPHALFPLIFIPLPPRLFPGALYRAPPQLLPVPPPGVWRRGLERHYGGVVATSQRKDVRAAGEYHPAQ